jgi:hypothetical protein
MPYSVTEMYVLGSGLIFAEVLSLLLRLLLIDKPYKIREIPFVVITVIILVLEVIKQTLEIIRGYNLFALPFHFCSLFIFLYPLAHFTKGKAKEYFQITASIYSFLVAIAMIFTPHLIVQTRASHLFRDFSSFHNVTFHMLVSLYGFMSIALHMTKVNLKKNIITTIVSMSLYWAFAIPVSYALNTNFNNSLKSGFPPLEAWHQQVGDFYYLLLIVPAFILLGVFITVIYYQINELVNNDLEEGENQLVSN